MFHGMFFNFEYLIWIAPALLLAFWAQMRVKATYAQASQVPAPLSGAAAARHILDSAGLNGVEIEQIPGQLTDHYDSHAKVLRLSPDVYNGRTLAAVGIAAHESGHALQDAYGYSPLVIRNAAVPVANFGSGISYVLIIAGFLLKSPPFLWGGIALFAGVVFFQLVNLPVEFNASSRAKAQLVGLGIINNDELLYVNKVLNAAAWTYVAATLQTVLTLLYYVSLANRSRN
ncbi:MAG TPA: zinc metallopeptidase [Pirellulales bacterium]|jgi:Zn-dependent membrane protease YugP|nr:zinc metallopeptidase [Pirellulales bacterium]